MGTLNTSINITSADTLAFSINQTVKGAGSTGEFAESGTKTITPLLSASFASGVGLLATRTCGANGAYVFVENPTTNTNNVELVGAADLNNAVSASGGIFANITNLYSFTTLKPGDSTIVPLSSGQGGVYAYTTSGTSTINYYIADREGAFGQSGIVVTTVGTTYQYGVLDSQAGVLSGGNPTPYFTSIDTGITSSFSSSVNSIVNNKGYALRFTDDQNGDHEIFKFIDTKGTIVGTLDTSGSINTDSLEDMGGYVVAYDSASNAVINHFDGDVLYTHVFSGSYGSIGSYQDYCSSDGAFVASINDYLGNSGDEAHILFNKDNYYVLSVLNEPATDLNINRVVTSLYGSFFFITVEDDNTGIYQRFQIWSTNGVLLKDLDVADYGFDTLDSVAYGSNKLQIVATDGNGVDYLLNYNGATNHLIGHNATNPQAPILNWSHTSNGNYDTKYIYAYDKYPTDSIRNYNYDWNSGMYDAESMAIVYSNAANNNSGSHINSEVEYCDIVYIMAGATTYGVHQFANDETKYIRIPGESGYNRVTPSSNLIAFNYSTGTYESGSLQILAITPTGVASSSLAPRLQDIDNANGDILATPVGEYILYSTSNNVTNKRTYTMAKSATRKGSVTTSTGSYDLYTRCNSVGLFDYNSDKGWYFNTSTNAFVELTNVFNWYDGGYDVNRSTTLNGLNDGNILIEPNSLSTTANAKMRLLKSGTATAEKQLPVTDGNWSLRLGSEAVFLRYQDMTDNYKYKINVYDLNLNLVKTIPLNTDTYEDLQVVGKRLYVKTYNVDQLLGSNYYSHYMISLKGMAYWLHEDNDSIIFNDKWWWDYELI
jgi:hypothetical protein